MASITLSNSNLSFDITVNGWEKTKDLLKVTIASDHVDESVFAGNETITLKDGTHEIEAHGYSNIVRMERTYNVLDADDVIRNVVTVTLATDEYSTSEDESTYEEPVLYEELSVSLEERVNDLEMAVCELYDSMAEL